MSKFRLAQRRSCTTQDSPAARKCKASFTVRDACSPQPRHRLQVIDLEQVRKLPSHKLRHAGSMPVTGFDFHALFGDRLDYDYPGDWHDR